VNKTANESQTTNKPWKLTSNVALGSISPPHFVFEMEKPVASLQGTRQDKISPHSGIDSDKYLLFPLRV